MRRPVQQFEFAYSVITETGGRGETGGVGGRRGTGRGLGRGGGGGTAGAKP